MVADSRCQRHNRPFVNESPDGYRYHEWAGGYCCSDDVFRARDGKAIRYEDIERTWKPAGGSKPRGRRPNSRPQQGRLE